MLMNKIKYYILYVTSTCWLVMFLTLLRDVTWIKNAFLSQILTYFHI